MWPIQSHTHNSENQNRQLFSIILTNLLDYHYKLHTLYFKFEGTIHVFFSWQKKEICIINFLSKYY